MAQGHQASLPFPFVGKQKRGDGGKEKKEWEAAGTTF